MGNCCADLITFLLAFWVPPLGVFLKFGCDTEFWLCLLLTLAGWLPGVVYAFIIIAKRLKEEERNGVVVVYYPLQ